MLFKKGMRKDLKLKKNERIRKRKEFQVKSKTKRKDEIIKMKRYFGKRKKIKNNMKEKWKKVTKKRRINMLKT